MVWTEDRERDDDVDGRAFFDDDGGVLGAGEGVTQNVSRWQSALLLTTLGDESLPLQHPGRRHRHQRKLVHRTFFDDDGGVLGELGAE